MQASIQRTVPHGGALGCQLTPQPGIMASSHVPFGYLLLNDALGIPSCCCPQPLPSPLRRGGAPSAGMQPTARRK